MLAVHCQERITGGAHAKIKHRTLQLFCSCASRVGVNMRVPVTIQQSKIGQSLNRYLTSFFFVRTIVRIVQVVRFILSFIFSQLFSSKKKKHPEVGQTYIDAGVETKKPSQPSSFEELEEGRLKDNFLSMASHELKTPMTTILGQAQLMKRRLAKIPELSTEQTFLRNALESIDTQTRRLNSLVDELLDMYNIRAGKIELHLRPCNLVTLCYEVVSEQRLLTGRTIQLDVPLSPIMMQADEGRLSQVIVNLVGNALRYSSEGSSVKINVDKRHKVGIIEVYDTGAGISQEDQAHIFEPFYRSP